MTPREVVFCKSLLGMPSDRTISRLKIPVASFDPDADSLIAKGLLKSDGKWLFMSSKGFEQLEKTIGKLGWCEIA